MVKNAPHMISNPTTLIASVTHYTERGFMTLLDQLFFVIVWLRFTPGKRLVGGKLLKFDHIKNHDSVNWDQIFALFTPTLDCKTFYA